jgi:hypothetical protein
MTFEEYLTLELSDQLLFDKDLEIDDRSLSDYDVDYTTQE